METKIDEKTRTLLLVFVFCQQLKAWLTHARDFGHLNRQFKYLSGILLNSLNSMLKYWFDGHGEEDDTIYEHSVHVSELVEKLVTLEDDDIKRVMGLVDKIKRERIAA